MFGYLGNSASFPQILLGHGSAGKLVLPGWAWRGLLSLVLPADSGGSGWRQGWPYVTLFLATVVGLGSRGVSS